MCLYYVSLRLNQQRIHEIHRAACERLLTQDLKNYNYVGCHKSVTAAVAEARGLGYAFISACPDCCID